MSKRTLKFIVILLLVFGSMFVLSVYLRLVQPHWTKVSKAVGQPITPAVSVVKLGLKPKLFLGKWTLLVLCFQPCSEASLADIKIRLIGVQKGFSAQEQGNTQIAVRKNIHWSTGQLWFHPIETTAGQTQQPVIALVDPNANIWFVFPAKRAAIMPISRTLTKALTPTIDAIDVSEK